MRRIAALACGLACLVLPASASAAITTTNDAPTLAGTLGAGAAVTAAGFFELPPIGTPHGTADAPLDGFPTEGTTFAILTSGNAALADDLNGSGGSGTSDGGTAAHGYGGAPGNAFDTSVLQINLNVPTGMSCLSFDYRFFSEEYPENVGDPVNDGFLAFVDPVGLATADPGGDIGAPENFAFDSGALVAVNSATMTVENAAGTTYDGATGILTASRSVTPGAHILYLAVFDQGDSVFDSAVFVDNLTFSDLTGAECDPQVERDAPAVTVDGPSSPTDDFPVFSGTAGTAAGDSSKVTVQVYPQGATTPIEVLTAAKDATGAWITQSNGLAPGEYFVQAHQTDSAGNVGASPANGFTVVGADTTPPEVRITSPASGSSTSDTTPTLSGTAGAASGDSSEIEVTLRAGSSASGTVVQSLLAGRTGGTWSVEAGALSPGTYTATAAQSDASDNVGVSPPVTFTVTSAPPPPPPPPPAQEVEANAVQSPEPVLGETVVAGKVGSGTVRIKGRDGKFRTLGANEAIPLGSEVDATKGRVRLTAAAGPGGQVQTGDFYKGAFIVTQTGGSKPITQLKLSAKLDCSTSAKAGGAKTSAKRKKVRRLWGDGTGRFRTRGRRAAATVRGTKWLTEDRCDSTKISVKRGKVLVRDFVKKKSKLITKGRSYVARIPKKKK
jgi:hypothetical protein